MDLSIWLASFSNWYKHRKHDQGRELEALIFSAPDSVFGPDLTDDQKQGSGLLARWMPSTFPTLSVSKSLSRF